ncbi:MAG: DUF4395 family protein [Pyrinomonadaceae bacterium]
MMQTISGTTRQRLEAQGFNLSDNEIVEFNYWLRLAPATCMLWLTVSLIFGSVFLAGALVPVGLLCFVFARHPFDAIYNYGLRYLTGGRKLPVYGAPRRFVCLIAAIMLASIAISFGLEFFTTAYVIGSSMVGMLFLNVLTGKCGPCGIYNRIVDAA